MFTSKRKISELEARCAWLEANRSSAPTSFQVQALERRTESMVTLSIALAVGIILLGADIEKLKKASKD